MSYPTELKYTKDHEWLRIAEGNIAVIGITEFAATELGDIVYVDISTVGENLNANDVFGSVEAVKTVSDLFLPISGKILEVNPELSNAPELINSDPYGNGWMVKVEMTNPSETEGLLSAEAYQQLVS
ncbi:glycine cleavage system protein GcvH [Haoranjiania flava]|uniref:Glycine cleavage system H protein n=1 Tax=Haoranjiania flava TaxID=1856322 RepID=A0AAE3IJJ7_9BACT|nr:glycine cleavage system protein GcvH [Haoranjiania flava]MCU7693247.1 glycine cleavage system protein GcvH [Haoranjiania flava]